MSGRPRSAGGDDNRRGAGSGRPRGASGGSNRSSGGRPSAGRSSSGGPRGGDGPRDGGSGRSRSEGGSGRSRSEGGSGRSRSDGGSGRLRSDIGGSQGPRGPRRPERGADRGGATRVRDTGADFAHRDGLPPVPENVDPSLLDRSVKAELRSLSKQNADAVARYLVAAGEALDDNPSGALEFARAARARAARVGAVREAVGIAAYHANEWSEALNELRTARRITGDSRNLAVMADCERALGRPAQAIRLLSDNAVGGLDREARLELFIVVAGARRDLGQLDAALAVLARGGLDRDKPRPGSVRLWYAYADALEAAGRKEDAANWFAASAALDPEGELDAAERAAALL